MSRKYLNKESRETVALAWQVIGILEKQEKYITTGPNHQEDKEKLKYLRTAITNLKKYFDIWSQPLDNVELEKVNRLIATTGLLFHDNYTARLKLNEYEFSNKFRKIEVDQDLIEDILDLAIAKQCFGCNKGKVDVESCRLRNVLMRYDAPATTENPLVCQFEYESIEKRVAKINNKLNKKGGIK